MAKLCLKKASKRQSFAKQYKIQKKVKDHNKKVRKEAKKKKQRAAQKPINVPNSCPFKEQILVEAEAAREALKAQKEAKIEAAKAVEQEKKAAKRKAPANSVAELAERASKDARAFEQQQSMQRETVEKLDDKSVKVYAAEVRKTIQMADVIIEVLDARDPLGSRSKEVEQQVLQSGKRLVLLLNKIDLVPKENALKWLDYLRKSFPTIAFKASTQEQAAKLGRFDSSNFSNSATAKCVGAELVMKLLANYCRNKDVKTSIRVGLVGYPNVGKSSVINSLKRKKACNVGATPGVTRQIQEIELDKKIHLLDSPGVVLVARSQLDAVEVALKNAIRIEQIADPLAPVQAILRRCTKDTLTMHYTIADFKTSEQFLVLVARKLGRLKKGGVPDIDAAARHVLADWTSGRLRYYTVPPEEPNKAAGEASIVSAFDAEFDFESLLQDSRQLVSDVSMDVGDVATVYSGAESAYLEKWNDEDESDTMDTCDDSQTVVTAGCRKKGTTNYGDATIPLPQSLAIDGNVQINRAIKKAVKRQKRQQKKSVKRADALAESMEIL